MAILKRIWPLTLTALLGLALVYSGSLGQIAAAVEEQSGAQAPMFEVDPFWPKPLPNHWLLGSTIGVDADAQDHIWIVHRASTLASNETSVLNDPPTSEECCLPAPPVLEFDRDGNLVSHWGGPGEGYDWPSSNHGITIDHMDNVWVGGNGGGDSHALKFTRSGEFLLQVGVAGRAPDSLSLDSFGRIAKIAVDGEANEIYFADGYGNKRVAVVDADTGQVKRFWGAYGNQPDDSYSQRYMPGGPNLQQFSSPVHCAEVSNSGLIYVCDRAHDRIQVFQKDGTYVDEMLVLPNTTGSGAAWDIDFSHDADQAYIYLADGVNQRIHIIDRVNLQHLTSFGDGGRQPGQFFGAHSVTVDSEGNLYTTETYEGKRIQKFVYKGMGSVTTQNQGVVWPDTTNQGQ
ncbi:MAG: hypothetical protein VX453_06605 [Acidobacteriota bacterium]|nr:hypothetical protein [Acidobacteriota bacterium]